MKRTLQTISLCLIFLLVLSLWAIAPTTKAQGNGSTQLTYYGHVAFKLVTPSGQVLLIDPWLTNPNNPTGEADLASLEQADFVLITHGHFDHVGDAVQIAQATDAQLVTTDDLGLALIEYVGYPEQLATPKTRGNFGGTVNLLDGEVEVTFVPAVHSSAITPLPEGAENLHNGGNPGGLVISVNNGPVIYHTGDTDVFSDMSLIARFHQVTAMLVCIGGQFTMDPERAAEALNEGRGAISRRQKDRLVGDSDSPLNVDRQIEDSGGGFRPKKEEGRRKSEPSAICLTTSAFQGGSLGKAG